ncbi:MAG: ORC1-type DNA replication protein [Thermoproteota archaeon]|jgi:cell division control protein 6|nr:ORC1-type DNA replication protein [Thermoproteota archaeon]
MSSFRLDDLISRLSERASRIFKNRETLRPDYIPDELPHRDKEIYKLAEILFHPLLKGDRPSNVFIYGYPGTGKTATTKHVFKAIKEKLAPRLQVPVYCLIINCKIDDTNYRILKEINDFFSIPTPHTGLSLAELYTRIVKELKRRTGFFILALDEIDNFVKKSGDEILYKLTRINSEGITTKVSLVGITNDLHFKEYLDPRVKSSLSEEELVFTPYTADQLRDILYARAKIALYEDSYTDGAINLCASIAAKEHGDVRRALDLLRVAGELAERRNDPKITEDHVKEALRIMERDKIWEVVISLPFHSKLVLLVIAYLQERFLRECTTGEVYEEYVKICREIGQEPLTARRVSDIINELDMGGLIKANLTSKGRYGRTKYISLRIDKDETFRALKEDERLEFIIQSISSWNR